MLNLERYLEASRKVMRDFLLELGKQRGFALFKDTLFLSFLGARICYASTSPLALFTEERFKDPQKFLSFLRRLKRSGHTSIFAHSPLVVSGSVYKDKSNALARLGFKLWWSPEGDYVCLNLRHVAEVVDEEEFSQILESSLEASKSWRSFPVYVLGFDDQGHPELRLQTILGDIVDHPPEVDSYMFSSMRVTVIDVAPAQTKPFGWLAVIVEGFSRLFSHQFVRHTWLNFNQRSHRYTSVDQFVLPPSFVSGEIQAYYTEIIRQAMQAYSTLVEQGIKKEDARFLTPQGASTALIATGPYFVWQDFVHKRAQPKAQWEIRRLAQAVAQVLEKCL